MNHSTWSQVLEHVPPALLVIFRIGGMMIYGPVFGSPVVLARVKVFLAVFIGLAVYPLLSVEHLSQQHLRLDLWMLGPLVALELLIGLLIGFIASLPLVAVQTGGLIMGQQVGLGFARFYNPAIDDEADIFGQLLFFMTIAGFLLVGGHEAMLLAMLNSFQHVPLGGFIPDGSMLDLIGYLLISALELALRVATPVLALVFLQSVAMGFISRTVPQLNILSLGFPLRILMGVLILALGLMIINDVIMEGVDEGMNLMFAWIESLSD